jgi:alpha-amylase/alpha-mannosidase (GH57 family)
MHQPDYRDHLQDAFQFPWTYLHAIKDYTDMAAHLEDCPGARAVVNFSPVLLEQLDHYERQVRACVDSQRPPRDALLAALESAVLPAETGQRLALVKSCLRVNRKNLIERFEPYRRLARLADHILGEQDCGAYLSNQYLADLVTWYHLAWLGETVRRTDAGVQSLVAQGSGYTVHQRRELLACIGSHLAAVRTRWRQLAADGRVELSTSPWGHPMLPLLLDFAAAREAQPDLALPGHRAYPGGVERARWHVEQGLATFESYFGMPARGCWPSEGGISAATLDLLDRAGLRWAATGESVLRNSVRKGTADSGPDPLYQAWHRPGAKLRLYARNDFLSDRIGFTYADWHADDAVADLVHHIEQIGAHWHGKPDPVVSIILDGENAWEYYPFNAWYFLHGLYERLSSHPRIRLATYSELEDVVPAQPLTGVTAGSWVHGTFSTWMGHEDKNRAWDILADAKRCYDEDCARAAPDPRRDEALARQLAVCEGSDWFWWFGDYNPAESVSDFEHLYRVHLANLYSMLGREPPQYLAQTLSHGTGTPRLGGVMRPGQPE